MFVLLYFTVSLELNADSFLKENHMCFINLFVGVAEAVTLGKSLVGLVCNGRLGAAVVHCCRPRCCLGQTKDGTILMLCIEGRYLDSLGATAPECAEILARYGAYQAMNLDGGTSAICWYDGESITRCSDPERPEGRPLPNCWIYG